MEIEASIYKECVTGRIKIEKCSRYISGYYTGLFGYY